MVCNLRPQMHVGKRYSEGGKREPERKQQGGEKKAEEELPHQKVATVKGVW